MNEIDRVTFKSQFPVFLSQIILCGAMLGVFAIVSRISKEVIFGAALGTAASLVNYAVMIISLLKAEKSETPEKAQLKVRGNYIFRMLGLVVVLVIALKFGPFDPLATLLPLILMRIALFIGGLLIRKGETV